MTMSLILTALGRRGIGAWIDGGLVLRDPRGRQVDFHPIVLDQQGSGWQEIPGASWCHYRAGGLRGSGTINRRRV